jgi:hypothetical protein
VGNQLIWLWLYRRLPTWSECDCFDCDCIGDCLTYLIVIVKETAYLMSGNEIAQVLFLFAMPLTVKVDLPSCRGSTEINFVRISIEINFDFRRSNKTKNFDLFRWKCFVISTFVLKSCNELAIPLSESIFRFQNRNQNWNSFEIKTEIPISTSKFRRNQYGISSKFRFCRK